MNKTSPVTKINRKCRLNEYKNGLLWSLGDLWMQNQTLDFLIVHDFFTTDSWYMFVIIIVVPNLLSSCFTWQLEKKNNIWEFWNNV